MAESILQGFLIKKIDYRIFDEIITILDKNGNRINCISLGSKKINSKNSRNLFIGSFNEFIIFRSSSEKRLSKLKKTTTIKIFDWKHTNDKSFILLNKCILNSLYTSVEFFLFYKNMIDVIESNQNEQIKILIILKNFITLSMLYIDGDIPYLNEFLNEKFVMIPNHKNFINNLILYLKNNVNINLA